MRNVLIHLMGCAKFDRIFDLQGFTFEQKFYAQKSRIYLCFTCISHKIFKDRFSSETNK